MRLPHAASHHDDVAPRAHTEVAVVARMAAALDNLAIPHGISWSIVEPD